MWILRLGSDSAEPPVLGGMGRVGESESRVGWSQPGRPDRMVLRKFGHTPYSR